MGGHANARRQEFWSRGRDREIRVASLNREFKMVVRAGQVLVDHFGLGHRTLKVDVPHGWRFVGVDFALVVQVEEGCLGDLATMIVDRLVFLLPIHRQRQPPPEFAVVLFVLVDEAVTGFDEVAPGNQTRRLLAIFGARLFEFEVFFIGRMRVATHVIVVLHPALGREAVVVPTHRVVDIHAAHALVARHHVSVGIRKDMTDVQRTRRSRGRRVDDEGFVARAIRVPAVNAAVFPFGDPALFDFFCFEVLSQRVGIDGANFVLTHLLL